MLGNIGPLAFPHISNQEGIGDTFPSSSEDTRVGGSPLASYTGIILTKTDECGKESGKETRQREGRR